MADVKTTAEEAITHHSERINIYVPGIVGRLIRVYALPFALAMLVTALGGRLATALLPYSTANLLILAINIVVLVTTWRWAERRWQGTATFILFANFSRARRALRALLASDATPTDIAAGIERFVSTADGVAQGLVQLGVQPRS